MLFFCFFYMLLNKDNIPEEINKHLPPQIRVFGTSQGDLQMLITNVYHLFAEINVLCIFTLGIINFEHQEFTIMGIE